MKDGALKNLEQEPSEQSLAILLEAKGLERAVDKTEYWNAFRRQKVWLVQMSRSTSVSEQHWTHS